MGVATWCCVEKDPEAATRIGEQGGYDLLAMSVKGTGMEIGTDAHIYHAFSKSSLLINVFLLVTRTTVD